MAEEQLRKPDPVRSIGNVFRTPPGRRQAHSQDLKTDVLTVAKFRLADFENEEREAANQQEQVARGKMTFGGALAAYRAETEATPLTQAAGKEVPPGGRQRFREVLEH